MSIDKDKTEYAVSMDNDNLLSTATEAQKKENTGIRTEQISEGLQVAKEKGLGEWAVKVAGRSFVRVGD